MHIGGQHAHRHAPTNTVSCNGPYRDPAVSEADRQYAMFTHLVTLISIAVPVLGLIVAAVMWGIGKSRSPYIDDHGRQAVNFHISIYAIYVILTAAGVFLTVISFGVLSVLFILAPLVVLAMTVLHIVVVIRAMIAAHRGEFYRYPACFRFLG